MKTIKKLAGMKLMGVLAALSMLSLTHCAQHSATGPTGDYNETDVGKINKVVQGVIVSERTVNVYNHPTTNNSMTSPDPATDVTRKIGYEYVIKLDTGSIVSVVQTENLHLEPKQHILVIYGTSTRVVADEGEAE